MWFTLYLDCLAKEDVKQISTINNLLKDKENDENRQYHLSYVKNWVNKERNELYLIACLDGGVNLHEFLVQKDTI